MELLYKILSIHTNTFVVHIKKIGLHTCPLLYGSLKIATFFARTGVFGQIVIFSKYAFFQWSVQKFRNIHHTDPNSVSK